jgi:hypothetical protein
MATIIYTLVNPVSNEVFYVGKCSTTLPSRLSVHITAKNKAAKLKAYLDALKPLRPLIEPLEICDDADTPGCERYWVGQMLAWGFKLVNVKYTKQVKVKVPKRTKIDFNTSGLSDNQMLLFKILSNGNDNKVIARLSGVTTTMVFNRISKGIIPKYMQSHVLSIYCKKAKDISYLFNNQ